MQHDADDPINIIDHLLTTSYNHSSQSKPTSTTNQPTPSVKITSNQGVSTRPHATHTTWIPTTRQHQDTPPEDDIDHTINTLLQTHQVPQSAEASSPQPATSSPPSDAVFSDILSSLAQSPQSDRRGTSPYMLSHQPQSQYQSYHHQQYPIYNATTTNYNAQPPPYPRQTHSLVPYPSRIAQLSAALRTQHPYTAHPPLSSSIHPPASIQSFQFSHTPSYRTGGHHTVAPASATAGGVGKGLRLGIGLASPSSNDIHHSPSLSNPQYPYHYYPHHQYPHQHYSQQPPHQSSSLPHITHVQPPLQPQPQPQPQPRPPQHQQQPHQSTNPSYSTPSLHSLRRAAEDLIPLTDGYVTRQHRQQQQQEYMTPQPQPPSQLQPHAHFLSPMVSQPVAHPQPHSSYLHSQQHLPPSTTAVVSTAPTAPTSPTTHPTDTPTHSAKVHPKMKRPKQAKQTKQTKQTSQKANPFKKVIIIHPHPHLHRAHKEPMSSEHPSASSTSSPPPVSPPPQPQPPSNSNHPLPAAHPPFAPLHPSSSVSGSERNHGSNHTDDNTHLRNGNGNSNDGDRSSNGNESSSAHLNSDLHLQPEDTSTATSPSPPSPSPHAPLPPPSSTPSHTIRTPIPSHVSSSRSDLRLRKSQPSHPMPSLQQTSTDRDLHRQQPPLSSSPPSPPSTTTTTPPSGHNAPPPPHHHHHHHASTRHPHPNSISTVSMSTHDSLPFTTYRSPSPYHPATTPNPSVAKDAVQPLPANMQSPQMSSRGSQQLPSSHAPPSHHSPPTTSPPPEQSTEDNSIDVVNGNPSKEHQSQQQQHQQQPPPPPSFELHQGPSQESKDGSQPRCDAQPSSLAQPQQERHTPSITTTSPPHPPSHPPTTHALPSRQRPPPPPIPPRTRKQPQSLPQHPPHLGGEALTQLPTLVTTPNHTSTPLPSAQHTMIEPPTLTQPPAPPLVSSPRSNPTQPPQSSPHGGKHPEDEPIPESPQGGEEDHRESGSDDTIDRQDGDRDSTHRHTEPQTPPNSSEMTSSNDAPLSTIRSIEDAEAFILRHLALRQSNTPQEAPANGTPPTPSTTHERQRDSSTADPSPRHSPTTTLSSGIAVSHLPSPDPRTVRPSTPRHSLSTPKRLAELAHSAIPNPSARRPSPRRSPPQSPPKHPSPSPSLSHARTTSSRHRQDHQPHHNKDSYRSFPTQPRQRSPAPSNQQQQTRHVHTEVTHLDRETPRHQQRGRHTPTHNDRAPVDRASTPSRRRDGVTPTRLDFDIANDGRHGNRKSDENHGSVPNSNNNNNDTPRNDLVSRLETSQKLADLLQNLFIDSDSGSDNSGSDNDSDLSDYDDGNNTNRAISNKGHNHDHPNYRKITSSPSPPGATRTTGHHTPVSHPHNIPTREQKRPSHRRAGKSTPRSPNLPYNAYLPHHHHHHHDDREVHQEIDSSHFPIDHSDPDNLHERIAHHKRVIANTSSLPALSSPSSADFQTPSIEHQYRSRMMEQGISIGELDELADIMEHAIMHGVEPSTVISHREAKRGQVQTISRVRGDSPPPVPSHGDSGYGDEYGDEYGDRKDNGNDGSLQNITRTPHRDTPGKRRGRHPEGTPGQRLISDEYTRLNNALPPISPRQSLHSHRITTPRVESTLPSTPSRPPQPHYTSTGLPLPLRSPHRSILKPPPPSILKTPHQSPHKSIFKHTSPHTPTRRGYVKEGDDDDDDDDSNNGDSGDDDDAPYQPRTPPHPTLLSHRSPAAAPSPFNPHAIPFLSTTRHHLPEMQDPMPILHHPEPRNASHHERHGSPIDPATSSRVDPSPPSGPLYFELTNVLPSTPPLDGEEEGAPYPSESASNLSNLGHHNARGNTVNGHTGGGHGHMDDGDNTHNTQLMALMGTFYSAVMTHNRIAKRNHQSMYIVDPQAFIQHGWQSLPLHTTVHFETDDDDDDDGDGNNHSNSPTNESRRLFQIIKKRLGSLARYHQHMMQVLYPQEVGDSHQDTQLVGSPNSHHQTHRDKV